MSVGVFFEKDNGIKLSVSDDYLIPFLSPTSRGTHYRSSSNQKEICDRQKGRVLLQIHQILHLFQEYGIDLKDKSMVDIGTGNGLVPCMLLELSELSSAVGADPFLDGEHKSSWQVHDQNKALIEIKEFLQKYCKNGMDYNSYKQLLNYENYSLIPSLFKCDQQPSKKYRFAKVGAHDLEKAGDNFDLFYCKAIEHISDWDGVFKSISKVANPDAVIYFKHRSFFSYLGAHRYSSINIPWGHVLLTDNEYKRFVDEHCSDHADEILDFYFNDLAYPRMTVSDMVRIANEHGFVPISVISEPTRYIDSVTSFIDNIDGFWDIVGDNYPNLCAEELFSGMYHILFRKK